MQSRYRYIITPKNLRSAVAGLPTGKTLDYLYMFLNIIYDNTRQDPYYFRENEELSKVLFTETFPSLIDYFISERAYADILSIIPTFVRLCNYMSYLHMFTFTPFLVKFFDIAKSLSSYDSYVYFQYQIQNVKKSATLNIFQKFLIDQIANQQIIQALINDFLFHQSFTEIEDFFTIFNSIFPYVEKTVLAKYEAEFSRFSFSIDDQRFEDPASVKLTKAMANCSTEYAQLHFDNIMKFLMSDFEDEMKGEFIELIQNSENLKAIQNNILEMLDFILASMREDEEKLREISSIFISNKIVDKNTFIEKAGNDIFFNVAFFDLFKENYTKEFVESIINSEDFCEETAIFIFKIIDLNIDLIPNLPKLLQKCYLSFWNEERMNVIVSMSKTEKNRKILMDSIENFEIKNIKIFKIVSEILSLLRPSADEFNYEDFADKVLFYTDSVFLIPYLKKNSFIPFNLIDLEDLVSFSVFDENLSNFLFENFSDDLINHIEFFLDLQIDDEIENKCLAKFLFNLYQRNNSIENNRLLWEAVIRNQDESDEIHSAAQRIINENPETSQNELFEKIEGGYSKFFINFDFSAFPETSSEENGNFLFFGKPKLVSPDSFFYLPSKIGHFLNHEGEKIDQSEVHELFEFQIGDIGIDAVIQSFAFDAAMKMNLEFKLIKQSLDIAFQLKFKKFIHKLFQYIIDRSEEVVQIDDELLNSFAEIDPNYAIELIKKKKVIDGILNLFFLKNQTFSALSILRGIDNEIQIDLLNYIVYTKNDLVNFINSNRIKETDILPFIFSINFPQFYRTKFLLNSVFQKVQSNPQLFLSFLNSQEWPKKSKFIKYTKNFIPYINSKFFTVYFAFSLMIQNFCSFPKQKLAVFLSNLIYEREGEEDPNISSPIKEPADDPSSQKFTASRSLFYQFLDKLISELPYEVLKKFEIFYITKNSHCSSESEIFHDFSLFVNSNLISEELKNLTFLNKPSVILFKIHKSIEFEIEEKIMINNEIYTLSCIGTKSSIYVPRKSMKKYVKYSNCDKTFSDEIEGKIVFIFYQKVEQTDFEILKNRFKKFRTCEFNFNKRAVICESLNKASIEWKNWKNDASLFDIATILLSEIGYTPLFKELSTNSTFSEHFFKSDWKDKFSITAKIHQELIGLAKIYPRREELVELLISSLKRDDRKRFSSIILNAFNLDDQSIEKVITNMSPPFDDCRDMILGYFMKKTTTNALLQTNQSLSRFVFDELEKMYSEKIEWKTINSLEELPYSHLLIPMSESLFSTCSKTLNKATNDLILRSFGNSPSTIAHSLTIFPHNDVMASLFCGIEESDKTAEELRNDIEWVSPSLSSNNDRIRLHSFRLIRYIFQKKDGDFLSDQLKKSVLNVLTKPFCDSVVGFVTDTFGYDCIDSPEFSSMVYDTIFNSPTVPLTYTSIEKLINCLSPPLSSSIIKWHSMVKNTEKNETTFLVYSADLIYASVKCEFQPPFVGFFNDILIPLFLNISIKTIQFFFNFLNENVKNDGVFKNIKMIVEFDVVFKEYYLFIEGLLLNYPDFRETETIILALNLPSVFMNRRNLIQKDFNKQISEGELLVRSIEVSNKALSIILKKDPKLLGFIRKSGHDDIDQLMVNFYRTSYLSFFSVDFFTVVDLFADEISGSKYSFESRISALKKIIKYVTLSSLSFRDVLKIVFDTISKIPGLRIFNKMLGHIELEWCELCCEICREILSDIEFSDQKKQAISLVDRELCCQLYHYNSAEKGYLKLLTSIMKNDQLRIESGLQENTQIFHVFRNNFVFCIDEVTAFIETSIDKYDGFFNSDDIKNLIMKLQINDVQIRQKLKIILILFEKSTEKMKSLVEEIFPKIEDLSSSEGIDDDLSELLNQVLEQALVVMSMIEE